MSGFISDLLSLDRGEEGAQVLDRSQGQRLRLELPPKRDPKTPRTIWPPICDPTERAPLLTIASSTPSRRPPRGPTLPIIRPPSSDQTVLVWFAAGEDTGGGAVAAEELVWARFFSISYADARSTG